MALKLRFPEARNIIGIATEPLSTDGQSEDLLYMDASQWTASEFAEAERLAKDLGLLQSDQWKSFHEDEFPEN